MVLQVGVELRRARPSTCAAAARHRPRSRSQHEAGAVARGRQVVGRSSTAPASASGGDHQGVPRGQPLVVQTGRTRCSRTSSSRERISSSRAGPRAAALQHVRAVLEVPLGGGAEELDAGPASSSPRASRSSLERPHVELALDALGVGIERRVEAALGTAHLPQRPVERLAANAPEQRLAGHLPAVQVGPGQQRVVVEHLLEVGTVQVRVHRVAGKAAAHLVVDAASRHRPQRGHATCRARRRRAGTRSPRPAGTWARRPSRRAAVEGLDQRLHGVLDRGSRRARPPAGPSGRSPAAPRRSCSPCRSMSSRRVFQAPATAWSTIAPAGHALALLGREVGAGEERPLVGGEEHVQRPAALPGHRLAGLHADGVDVGPLLAIDLDATRTLVHQRGDVSSSKVSCAIT